MNAPLELNERELLALAERAERVGLNLARHAFPNRVEWDNSALADAAHGFAVAAALRAIAAKGS